MANINGNGKVTMARIDERLKAVQVDVIEVKALIKSDYVTRTEFEPVKKIVYGMVALILTAVLGALVGLVLIQ
jgi:hypothetical protein